MLRRARALAAPRPLLRQLCTRTALEAPGGMLRRARALAAPRSLLRQLCTRTALEAQEAQRQLLARTVQRARAAERARFGLPAWQILAGGLFGVGLAARWWSRVLESRGDAPAATDVSLRPREPIFEEAHAQRILVDVRRTLARHEVSLGNLRLRVRLRDLAAEGATQKAHGRVGPGRGRGARSVDEISLRPGLDAVHAAQVLAHEFMHAWLWMMDFPPLDPSVEEGLCELGSYLFLLSSLREPDSASAVQHDEGALREQIHDIESNQHPLYGHAFQRAAACLRGRQLHELLAFVREHGRLPPPAPRASVSSGKSMPSNDESP